MPSGIPSAPSTPFSQMVRLFSGIPDATDPCSRSHPRLKPISSLQSPPWNSVRDVLVPFKGWRKKYDAATGPGGFRLHITTKTNSDLGEAHITKVQLVALEDCEGEVLVICNSCHSGYLVSDCWTLLCSTAPNQPAEALSQSGCGNIRGSAFTACALGQVALEHGLLRAGPRPHGRLVDLPPSPPPLVAMTILRPSDISFEDFLRRMVNMEGFLADNMVNLFQVKGLQSTVTWTSTSRSNSQQGSWDRSVPSQTLRTTHQGSTH